MAKPYRIRLMDDRTRSAGLPQQSRLQWLEAPGHPAGGGFGDILPLSGGGLKSLTRRTGLGIDATRETGIVDCRAPQVDGRLALGLQSLNDLVVHLEDALCGGGN